MSKVKELEKILGEQVEIADQKELTETVIETTAIKEEKKDVSANLIPVDDKGNLQFQNHLQITNYCKYMTRTGMVPDRFDTPEKLFGALMYVRDLGLPDTAIRQVANIKGTPSIYGDLPLAVAWRSGKLESVREEWFDKDYNKICFENKNLTAKTFGAVCFIKRKGATEARSYSFTLDNATKAGLYPAKKADGSPNPNSPWEKYTEIMLRYKARSIALKSELPDALNGISIAEYDHDEIPEKDVTPIELKESFESKLTRLKNGTNK